MAESENNQRKPDEIAKMIGNRIRKRREALSLSQIALARLCNLKSDRSVRDWESGKSGVALDRRHTLAAALKTSPEELFDERLERVRITSPATLISGQDELSELLVYLVQQTAKLKTFRVNPDIRGPMGRTPRGVLLEFRKIISARLLDGSLEVYATETITGLDHLKELIWNMHRYEYWAYWLKVYGSTWHEAILRRFAAFDFLMFDDRNIVLTGCWDDRVAFGQNSKNTSLWITGDAVLEFFEPYWQYIWQRGVTVKEPISDASVWVKKLKQVVGLFDLLPDDRRNNWRLIVKDALNTDIGDGAPPLV